jgi:hypothetical protein
MRTALIAGALGAVLVLLVACGEDRLASTEPTVPVALARAGTTLDGTHNYEIAIKCSSGWWVQINYPSGGSNFIATSCEVPQWGTSHGTFTSFDYYFAQGGQSGQIVCSATGITTTGTFKCGSRAQFKITDLGPL